MKAWRDNTGTIVAYGNALAENSAYITIDITPEAVLNLPVPLPLPVPPPPPTPDITAIITALTNSPSIDQATKNSLISALKGN